MANVTFKHTLVHTVGTLPSIGSLAPSFVLTKTNLTDIRLEEFRGKKVLLNIFISLDTPTCATSVRKFNLELNRLKNVVILCVSADLPFAQERFCGAENIENVIHVSTFRNPEFGENYGVKIVDGPLTGLLARAIVIINEEGNIIYTQQVSELTDEPDYAAALKALNPLVAN